MLKYYFLLLLISFNCTISYSQLASSTRNDSNHKNNRASEITFTSDTVNENLNIDTLKTGDKFYKNLKAKAYKNKITKELYGLFFVSSSKAEAVHDKKREQSGQDFLPYQGMRINKIVIDVIPPFKPNFLDSIQRTRIWLEKTANKLHNTSRSGHIKKHLYIKKGDTIDAYNIADNERLIRDLPYIKDAQFITIPVMGSSKLVNLYLLVKDQFSWGFDVDVGSIKSTSLEMYNRNLYGRGHELKAGFEFSPGEKQTWGYISSYKIRNISKTHINGGLTFSSNYKKSLIELAIDKQFESYLTKYAGGLTLSKTTHSDKIKLNDPILNEEPLDFHYALAWFGRSYKLQTKKKLAKSRLFTALSFSSLSFFKRPKVAHDQNKFFHNKKIYLASIAINQTQYFKSNLIYNYGRTEDIPYGYLMQLTGGIEDREFSYRKYLAFEYQRATHFHKSKAYFFTKLVIGGYFNKDHYEQGNFIFQNKFISRLRKAGRYRYRNFIQLNYNLGIRRFPEEFITLNTPTGIQGFSSLSTKGTQRLTLKLEQVTFTPYMAAGFRFSFFNFIDAGTIGTNQRHPFKNKAYYGIGLGLRLNNENLVFKTIQLSFTFYPKAPSDFSHFHYGMSGEDRPKFSNFNVSRPKVIDFE